MRRSFRILSYDAHVDAPAALVHELQRLMPDAPAWSLDGQAVASHTWEVETIADGWRVVGDGRTVWSSQTRKEDVAPRLAWMISDAALQHLRQGEHLLFHGGAVSYGSCGVILPASSQCGKTTLVAGLVAGGFRYYSDDIVVLEPTTFRLMPFAKCLHVKAGARGILAERYPALADGQVPQSHGSAETIWYLPPPANAWPIGPAVVTHLVMPTYVAEAEPELRPISRSQALECLFQQSFNLRSAGAVGVQRVVEWLRTVECFSFTVGDLNRSVGLLRDALGTTGCQRQI